MQKAGEFPLPFVLLTAERIHKVKIVLMLIMIMCVPIFGQSPQLNRMEKDLSVIQTNQTNLMKKIDDFTKSHIVLHDKLDKILNGDNQTSGVITQVQMNTQFRKDMTWAIKIGLAALITEIIAILFLLFKYVSLTKKVNGVLQ